MPHAGRKTILTEDTITKLVDLISTCNTNKGACGAIGLNYDTFAHWLTKGEKHPSTIYGQLFQAVKIANQMRRSQFEAVVAEAGLTDWKAAATYLERTEDEWKRYQKIEAKVSGTLTQVIEEEFKRSEQDVK